MPPKGRTPSRPPRRRPKVAGHGHVRPPTPPAQPDPQVEQPPLETADGLAEPVELPAAEHAVDEPPALAEPAQTDAETAAATTTQTRAADTDAPADHVPLDDTATDPDAGPSKAGTRRPKPERRAERTGKPTSSSRRGWVQLLLLVLLILLFGTLAAVFRGQADRASTGAANNRAVIDTGASTEVIGQVSKAIETVLSYDHTKLDDNEKAAREVTTGKYVDEYNLTFADIRKTAIEQKVVLNTTVLLAGVKQLSGDRAEVIATMDLASVRAGAPANAPGRVRVVANRVDGRWKIAEMQLL